LIALLDCEAADLAIEFAEDVVYVGAEVIGGNSGGLAFEILVFEDCCAATV
jgi:hypothetical protein